MAFHLHIAREQAQGDGTRSGPIRVVLADDHALIRRSMRRVLDGEEGIDVVSETAELGSTFRDVRVHHPHVLVFDLRLPGCSSDATIRRLRAGVARTAIVLASMELNPALAQLALNLGVLGFVCKDLSDTELAPAVRAAARGQRYVSPRVGVHLGNWRTAPTV